MTSFGGLNLRGDIGTIAIGAFLFLLLFSGIMTMVMLWHWKRYGFNMKGIVLAEVVYLIGLAILLGGAFFELNFLI